MTIRQDVCVQELSTGTSKSTKARALIGAAIHNQCWHYLCWSVPTILQITANIKN